MIWTKPIGTACLILGEIVSFSIDKEIGQLGARDRLIRLNLPLYFAFKRDGKTRKWSFATIGVIHDVEEEDGSMNIGSEPVDS